MDPGRTGRSQGVGALAKLASAPTGSRLALDQDRARRIFAQLRASDRKQVFNAVRTMVKQRPAEPKRRPVPKDSWKHQPAMIARRNHGGHGR